MVLEPKVPSGFKPIVLLFYMLPKLRDFFSNWTGCVCETSYHEVLIVGVFWKYMIHNMHTKY